jgi:hypothetical protein
VSVPFMWFDLATPDADVSFTAAPSLSFQMPGPWPVGGWLTMLAGGGRLSRVVAHGHIPPLRHRSSEAAGQRSAV